jgi:hypothetical protein
MLRSKNDAEIMREIKPFATAAKLDEVYAHMFDTDWTI